MTTGEAAAILDVTQQAVRDWIRAGTLTGEKRGRSFWVDSASVSEFAQRRGVVQAEGPVSATAHADGGPREADDGPRAVDEGSPQLAALRLRVENIERERDRFRAELATAREAAALAMAANQELENALRKVLDVLALQREVATQLLAPDSPESLGSSHIVTET